VKFYGLNSLLITGFLLASAEIISRQVGRVDEIVAGLLTFARQQLRSVGRVSLVPVLEDILAQVGHQMPLDRIEVNAEFAWEFAEVDGIGNQLRDIL